MRFACALCALLLAAAAPRARAQAAPGEILWKAKNGFELSPAPQAADLTLDGRLEVVLVAPNNRVAALELDAKTTLWEATPKLEGQLVNSPAIGNFLGDGTLDILLLSSGGSLALLDGLTGRLLSEAKLGFEPAASPTLFPIKEKGAFDAALRQGAAIVSSGGQVSGYIFSPNSPPIDYFAANVGPILKHSAAVGLTGYDKPEPHLVTASHEGKITIISPAPGSAEMISYSLPRGASETWFGLGELTGDGLEEILLADSGGYLYALSVSGSQFSEVWPRVSIDAKPNGSPTMIDVNGDKKDDIVISKPPDEILLVDGATGRRDTLWTAPAYLHGVEIVSPLSAFRAADGKAYVAFSDANGAVGFLDIKARTAAKEGAGGPIQLDADAGSHGSPIVGPLLGGPGIEAFVVGWRNGVGYLGASGLAAAPGEPAWLGDGASSARAFSLSPSYRGYLAERDKFLRGKLDAAIAQAQALYDAKDWKKAMEAAEIALASDPRRPEARSIHKRARLRKNMALLALFGGLGAAFLGFLGWQAGTAGLRQMRLNQYRRALAQGDKAKAAEIMLALHAAAPARTSYLKSLADLCIDMRRFDEETCAIYAKARAAFPGDQNYLKAQAMAYSSIKKQDSEAAAVFQEMMKVSTQTGPWAFALGQTLFSIGRDKEALDAFRAAASAGITDPEMPRFLSDLYVKLNITQPEALRTMGEVLDQKRSDLEFLKTYCRAARQSRMFDERAQKAARWLLASAPASEDAHVILASSLLQAGSSKEAMMHAEAILQGDPNDSVGLRLLGACYAAENRLDDTAMQIFKRALEANPEAEEMLIAVSHGYIHAGREDEEAFQTYERALRSRPDDTTILQHMAKIAANRSDDDLAISSIEGLLKLKHHSRLLILQLADAYCRKGILDDAAEPIYREALLFQPDHATVAANLATLYARKNRRDQEALAVYDTVYKANPRRRDIGRQLAYACDKAELSDRVRDLTQRLLAEDPGDDEMKKLLAHASVALDNMDHAIQTYEQVLDRNPDDQETIVRLALLYGRKRLADAASVKIYQRAARAQPDNHEVHAALARAHAGQANWDQVVATLKHFLSHAPKRISDGIALMEELAEANPKAIPLRWFLVDTLTYDSRLRDAVRHLIDILEIDPSDLDRALASFDKILDKNPKDASAHQQRGRLLLGMGRLSEARQALEQAHRYRSADESIARDLMDIYQRILERSESADIRFQLGKMALKVGKFDIAISCFQKTDKDYRWENASVKLLARAFIAKGMLDLALAELRRLAMDDEVKEILYELGQRYEAVNDIRGAREVYKAIFAVDIGYLDVKGKLESLESSRADALKAERTAIVNALSDQAKNRYELIEELGRGAMGIVYKAKDHELEEVVALKILPESLGQNAEALRRFRQEARNARHLAHPNIVRIHDIGEEMGRKYISMEFVNGSDLKQRIVDCNRKLPFEETLGYTRQIVGAIAAAHDAGIVHRDIKPANIMLTKEGKVKITDFGIAKAMEDDAHVGAKDATKVGAVVGTPLYMSPEQVQGKNVDYRSDIYSLGVMLYEMSSGRPPFLEGDLAYHHVFTEPTMVEGVPEPFAKLVMRCLAKKPEDRWQNAREILDELKRIAA